MVADWRIAKNTRANKCYNEVVAKVYYLKGSIDKTLEKQK